LNAEEFRSHLVSSTDLDEATIDCLVEQLNTSVVYISQMLCLINLLLKIGTEDGDGKVSLVSEVLSVGELVAMDWKVGVAVESNLTKKLLSPFVTLKLRIRRTDGEVDTHCVELSIPEFQVRKVPSPNRSNWESIFDRI
jgi:hypothetical protein